MGGAREGDNHDERWLDAADTLPNTSATRASAARELFPDAALCERGDIVAGRYEVVELLGVGGMGAVFRAHEREGERTVAIKLLHPVLAREPENVRRFTREAKAAARVRSPHIGRVYEAGQLDSGVPYFVMDYFEGETLAERLHTSGQLPPSSACEIVIGLLRGLQAAHQAEIVHRDLKPENVFLAKHAPS
jgi:serine/threonine-protein kinase